MENVFRLFDFNIYNEKQEDDYDGEENVSRQDKNTFMIQMFGLNEKGETCSVIVEDFKPFFYVKIPSNWSAISKNDFLEHIKNKMGKYYKDSVCECTIVKRKKLYGFDAGKDHKFIMLKFTNMQAFNKAKNVWYYDGVNRDGEKERKLLPYGYKYGHANLYLYESNIPPLLRFFHINEISPSGWVSLPESKCVLLSEQNKTSTCKYEFIINYKYIIALNDKETRVPYKICSFDIEASSSHGDFPLPIKNYKKLSTNIVDYFHKLVMEITPTLCKNILKRIILSAFGYEKMVEIDLVYPKKTIAKQELVGITESWLQSKVRDYKSLVENKNTIDVIFNTMCEEEDDDEDAHGTHKKHSHYENNAATIIDILCDKKFEREGKINELTYSFKSCFPDLHGDKVTFIGSTFLNYGEKEPYLNNCIVLNTSDPIANTELETYATEKEVLLAWRNLIQRENPDIIIGYNIFGFDYKFMFHRAEECGCVEEFLKLSRNKNEVCGTFDVHTNRYKIEESKISIASGTHELHFIKMNGRLQIDMYNFFRREENLSSYKLDYVAGYFIGDYVKEIQFPDTNTSRIKTFNLTGILVDSFIHFEEIGHSVEYYKSGEKFRITNLNKQEGWFEIMGNEMPNMSKKVRWCLAKDDVTPKDIFQMTNGTSADRSVIAKYCIQDCNLVHYLANKVDVITGLVEMAKICSVPISFLIFRGQGIKLTSYVAKKCREKRTLMPVIEKGSMDDGYEGAICLEPKCDMYLDNPVACVDYASLYPSSMISENLSHDSKVWTKEYDLAGNLINTFGERDKDGIFIYDNLPEYEYIDITYDTFKYIRRTPKSTAEKVRSGYKICRFAQFAEGRAIMPSILEELLAARKSTRKQIPLQTDEFMKNVLDKRQLAYKITANSLYGQCGAKTSTFYEQDIAASTTATGRLLLTYGKKIIEECYGNNICNTKYGAVLTKAEYIYGDSVANYTPVYVSIFKNNKRIIDVLTIEDLAIKYGNNNWVASREEGKQTKEYCELYGVDTWSDKGWTKLHRIIRHILAPHKRMIRISTLSGLVDVTDDHSLLTRDGKEISPNNVTLGTELLHNDLPNFENNTEIFQMITRLTINENQEIVFKNHREAALYCALLSKNGYEYMIDYSIDTNSIDYNSNKYIIKISKMVPNDNIYAIKKMEEINYSGYVYDLTTDNHHFAAGIGNMIVHNTDSVFFTFNLQTPSGELIRGEKALEITIELAKEAGHLASKFLKGPHDLEYEKTFMPFCLLSKKRYVGMLYENDYKKGKRKEMGIVLKRRDNAPIVKEIYGGIIDILMKEQNIQKALDFLNKNLDDIVNERISIDKLIITKSLNSTYKNPQQIAHKVLADRITAREPGNKPSSGDRIPFIYIHTNDKKALQGEKIETPMFIKDHKLKIDYSFYITNQIMKPLQQLFSLVLEDIWKLQNKTTKMIQFQREIETLHKSSDTDKIDDKIETLKNKEVKALLFDDYLRKTNNEKMGNQSLTKWFTPKK
jgi:DNA polymerase elongation subunit (family B)